MDAPFHSKAGVERVVFRLFVAGDEPHSRAARANLGEFRATRETSPGKIEVVDVFKSPETALENGIFVTPTLIVSSKTSRMVLYGDLSDMGEIARALNLVEGG